jgi:hypothetical protein
MTKEDYYKLFQGKTCKKMSRESKKKELKEVHRIKMEIKEWMRNKLHRDWPVPHILANISRNHKHYGDTPQEHAKRKLENNS